MPSVADELAALRKQSLTKSHASKLQTANGLRTPEQEEEALKDAKSKTSIKTYTKDAVETLNRGSKAVDQDMQVRLEQNALKKKDMEKKKEAAKNLQSFKGLATNNIAPATPTEATEASSTPTIKPEATTTSINDVPDLEEIPEMEAPVAETVEDEIPALVERTAAQPTAVAPRVQNRAEKKARKVMERLGMKPVEDISRVTLKMHGNQGFYTIYQPDVFEKSGSYIVFGEARQGTGMPSPEARAAAQVAATPVEEKKIEAVEEVEEEVDETGVEAKDIELVMSQAGCSRAKAVKALKDNDGDLVNAIMSLTN